MQEIQKAVEMMKSVEWESIRTEKFPLTPIALFESFTSTAESLVSRHAAEMKRRQQWLASALAEDGDESQGQPVPIIASTAGKYGVFVKGGLFEVTVFVSICLRLYIHSCQWPRLVRDKQTVAIKNTRWIWKNLK